MKRIAIITNHADDIYCFRKELIEKLYDDGNEIIISCPYGEKLDLLNNIKFELDKPIIDRRGINPFEDLKLLIHYIKFIKKFKPDIILAYTIKPNVYASIASRYCKVEYINNITGLGSVLNKGKTLQYMIYKLLKFALKDSKCVFFQNETNMKLILNKNIISGKYQLIPGSGVNTSRFTLQEYPQDDDIIVFNYIGRILSEKGIDDYIEAAKKIKSKYNNTEFNIIGFIEPTESHYVEDFKELEKNKIIVYRGEQKDVRPFIQRAHAIIHPSKYGEGMSNVLLENASSGRPIITTDNPGCYETVDNNITGYIYSPGNVDELVEKIEQFINLTNDEKKSMGLKGRKKIEREFNRNIVIQKYMKEIKGA